VSEPAPGMMVTSNVRLVRPLSAGGMGSVWVADHLSLRTSVVVKFMGREMTGNPEAAARFAREAAAASQVKSPHVVQMLDHGVGDEGRPYIVMELLEGRDLEQRLQASKRLDPPEAIAIVAQLARALSKAHERGIVHRDVKPSNVFLLDAGGGELFVKLLDFGIAKGPEVGIVGSTTRTGAFVGSPYYMSPEQVVGAKEIDFRTDLWSLGVVAYQTLTGQLPFCAETVGALAIKIHRDPLPLPTGANQDLPRAVDDWFVRACARDPGERFASAREMADALAKAMSAESAPARARVAGPDEAASRRPVDSRSETGAGVGLVASGTPAAGSRGRRWLLGAAAVAAIGAGLALPRTSTKQGGAIRPESASEERAAPVAVGPTATPIATATATPTATATATPTATATATPTATAVASRAKARPSPASPSAIPSSVPRPSVTLTPPPGSDDDIK